MVPMFISILITSIIYLLLPTIFFILKKDISKKNRTIICAVYCAIVCLIIQIINYNTIVNYKIKFTTGLFYYFILTSIISVIPIEDKNKEKVDGLNSENNNLKNVSKHNTYIKIFSIIALILIILIVGVSSIQDNTNNKKKSEKEKEDDTELTTHAQEPCSYYPIDGNYNIIISAESSAGVGDVFSKMDSNLEYRIHDNNYGDKYISGRKYQGDQTRYECDEVWYEVYLQNGKHGFIWAGRDGMYAKEQ